MKEDIKNVYYLIRDRISSQAIIRIGETDISVPSYYKKSMEWALETERPIIYDLQSEIEESDVLWDVGAHAGLYSIIAAKNGAEVIAIEAYGPNVDRLERYATWNNVEFDILELALRSGDSDVIRLAGSNRTVPTFSGDQLIGDGVSAPPILKIDVEDAEYDVLSGFSESFYENVKIIYCEVHPGLLQDRDIPKSAIYELLENHNFNVEEYTLREHDNVQPIIKLVRI